MRLTRTQCFTLLTILLTNVLVGVFAAVPQIWSTSVQAENEVKLAREQARIERREQRKATSRVFLTACTELAVGFYQAAQSQTVDELRAAFTKLPAKNAAYLVAYGAASADFPEVTGVELPKNSIVGPAGPIEAINEASMPSLKAKLLQGAESLNASCETVTNRLLAGLRGEYSTTWTEQHHDE